MPGELVTIATLNTRGIPLTGSQREVTVESAALVFAEKEPPGYVSDHIGWRAGLSLTSGTPGRYGASSGA